MGLFACRRFILRFCCCVTKFVRQELEPTRASHFETRCEYGMFACECGGYVTATVAVSDARLALRLIVLRKNILLESEQAYSTA